jgi:outer membrane protein W
VSFEYSRSTKNSESRDYVEDNGDPIAQTTRLSQVPFTVTLRYYPRKLGESVGSYAWMPTRLNPYVGGGIGLLHYDFSQNGRFVRETDLNIINLNLKSSGFTDTEHLVAGMDISLTPKVFVNGEARYSWANAELSDNFVGFQPIDLAGFRLLGGIYFRF